MINKNNDYNKRILIATILSTVLIISWIKYYARKTLPEAKQFEEMQELKKKETLSNVKYMIQRFFLLPKF